MEDYYNEMYAEFREQMYEKFDEEIDPGISYEQNIKAFLNELYNSYFDIQHELNGYLEYLRVHSRRLDDEEMEGLQESINDARIEMGIIDQFIKEVELSIPPEPENYYR